MDAVLGNPQGGGAVHQPVHQLHLQILKGNHQLQDLRLLVFRQHQLQNLFQKFFQKLHSRIFYGGDGGGSLLRRQAQKLVYDHALAHQRIFVRVLSDAPFLDFPLPADHGRKHPGLLPAQHGRLRVCIAQIDTDNQFLHLVPLYSISGNSFSTIRSSAAYLSILSFSLSSSFIPR